MNPRIVVIAIKIFLPTRSFQAGAVKKLSKLRVGDFGSINEEFHELDAVLRLLIFGAGTRTHQKRSGGNTNHRAGDDLSGANEIYALKKKQRQYCSRLPKKKSNHTDFEASILRKAILLRNRVAGMNQKHRLRGSCEEPQSDLVY